MYTHMNKTLSAGVLALVVLGGVWWFGSNQTQTTPPVTGVTAGAVSTNSPEDLSEGLVLGGETITVYKTSTCGCCGVFVQYLEREGATVQVENVTDLSQIKKQYGIPPEMNSCHTSVVGGYVVEGHIPRTVIEKLLAEKPDIAGIALPGMPSGSPGMPGPKSEPWTIYALQKDGSVTEFTTI